LGEKYQTMTTTKSISHQKHSTGTGITQLTPDEVDQLIS